MHIHSILVDFGFPCKSCIMEVRGDYPFKGGNVAEETQEVEEEETPVEGEAEEEESDEEEEGS